MTLDECKSVLTKIQLGDNRQVDRLVILEWFDNIGQLDYQDAIDAVRVHRQTAPDTYLNPGHIIQQVKRSRQGQADTTPEKYRELNAGILKPAPKPTNFVAMSRAWNNPARFAIETEKYNVQLRAAGFEAVDPWTM